MRYAPGAIFLLAICMASVAEANENFTVVLHARIPHATGSCIVADLPSCDVGSPANTQIDPLTSFRLYIFVRNFTELVAFQTCLLWPDDWQVNPDGDLGQPCTSGTFVAHDTVGNGDSTVDGTYAASFDCVVGPAIAKIHRIDFQAGASGCLTQANPSQGSQMVEVDDCAPSPPGGNPTLLDASTPGGQLRLGSICVGVPGNLAGCAVPVEPVTWGRVKATYK